MLNNKGQALHSALHRIQTYRGFRRVCRRSFGVALRSSSHSNEFKAFGFVEIYEVLHSALHRIQTREITREGTLIVRLHSALHRIQTECLQRLMAASYACCTPLFIAFKQEAVGLYKDNELLLHSALHRIQTGLLHSDQKQSEFSCTPLFIAFKRDSETRI